jgi:hypothetical protein
MRLSKVSRTAAAVGRAIAPATANPRVEPVRRVEQTEERHEPMLRRTLPEREPDEAPRRGTYLNLVV